MNHTIDHTLQQFKREGEENAAAVTAKQLGATYANLDDYPFGLDVLLLVDFKTAQDKQYAAYIQSQSKVRVALVDADNKEALAEIAQLASKWHKEIEYTIVSPTSFRYLLNSYARLVAERKQEEDQLNIKRTEDEKKNYYHHIHSLEDLQKEAERASTTELLDVILAAAFNQGASDVHLEPGENQLDIRFRIDGVLQKVLNIPMAQYKQLLSRIKIMSQMKLDEQSNTQDGRFGLQNKGINADLRVSTIPTGYGQGVVMRILRQDTQALTIQELGFTPQNQALIESAIKKPYGLILVTGPTGSGKSTTLYALLKQLNSPEKKIITLEDPIEYRLAGVQQSQVDAEKGFSFAEGLRGTLRQDPDIVMVGEIRDPETATIALNASLTGHLVLSTLHTNNAVTAQTRFLEMGIPPFLLTNSIQLIIAQRLVRRLAPESTPEKPVYKGRLVISEVLKPNQEFEQGVIAHKDQASLQEIAERGGMIPMIKDGLSKVEQGMTTESEIYRVTSV